MRGMSFPTDAPLDALLRYGDDQVAAGVADLHRLIPPKDFSTMSSPEQSPPVSGAGLSDQIIDASKSTFMLNLQTPRWLMLCIGVTAADYNGREFDGSPFEDNPQWLKDAVQAGKVYVASSHETDYAVWGVKQSDEPDLQAWPGDQIAYFPGTGKLSVIKAPVFEAIMRSFGQWEKYQAQRKAQHA